MNHDNLKQTIDNILQQYGMHKILYDINVEKSLSLTQDELKGMSAEDCGIHAYTLKQYALYLQNEANKLSVVVKWAARNINILLASEYNNIGDKYTKYFIKRNMLIKNNSYATQLYEIYEKFKIQRQMLNNISKNVHYVASTLLDLQYTKRYQK